MDETYEKQQRALSAAENGACYAAQAEEGRRYSEGAGILQRIGTFHSQQGGGAELAKVLLKNGCAACRKSAGYGNAA